MSKTSNFLTTPDIALSRSSASADLTREASNLTKVDQLCSEIVDYNSVPIDLLILAERENRP